MYELWNQTCLDENSGSTTNYLRDLGRITQPSWALFPYLQNGGSNSNYVRLNEVMQVKHLLVLDTW